MSADADKIVLIPSTKEKSTKSKKMELVEIEINFSDIEKATVMVSFK